MRKLMTVMVVCCGLLSGCRDNNLARQERIEKSLMDRGVEITPNISEEISLKLKSIATFDPAEDKKIKRIIEELTSKQVVTLPLEATSVRPSSDSNATLMNQIKQRGENE